MFVPVPPQSGSDLQQRQADNSRYRQNSGKPFVDPSSAMFLCGAVICQFLSAVFTLFPWTRYMGDSFVGYEAHELAPLYDGLAGKLNLLASAALLLGVIPVVKHHSPSSLTMLALAMTVWNLGFVVWLVVLYVRLGIFRDIGITLTLAAEAGVTVCLVGYWVRCRTSRPG